MPDIFANPPRDCPLCPRLVAFRLENREAHPAWWNAPVPAFGALDAKLLVVGLAPGLRGANATGRPFTGDYAGIILYGALKKAGLARGVYAPPPLAGGGWEEGGRMDRKKVAKPTHPNHSASCLLRRQPHLVPQGGRESTSRTDRLPNGFHDGFTLVNTRVTNGVRCVPPQNKPIPEEIRTCNRFLQAEIGAMPSLRVILSLGAISHQAVLRALGKKQSAYKFSHAAEHDMGNGLTLLDSYHTSRYNMNTGVLTEKMFERVILSANKLITEIN